MVNKNVLSCLLKYGKEVNAVMLVCAFTWTSCVICDVGAYNTSIVASSSRVFSQHRHHVSPLGAKSRSLGSVHSSQSAPADWFHEPSPAQPPRRGASVRNPPRTPSPPPGVETDTVYRHDGESLPRREPSPSGDQASEPLLARPVCRSTSSDPLASSAATSLVDACSPDRRSLWLEIRSNANMALRQNIITCQGRI